MHFEDNFIVQSPLSTVWHFVTTPNEFVKTIPDLKKYEKISETEFHASFKIGLGMIKGTMNMQFSFSDLKPMSSLVVRGRGTGPQLSVDILISLALNAEADKTKVAWFADVAIGGVAASVGSRLIESTTKTKVKEIVQGIKSKLEK
jgi:carbon monoxide dehydrogenase subunit G